MYNPFKTD